MKKIGLICDKKSKKIFLLPEQVSFLAGKGIEIFVTAGYGAGLNIADEKYLNAGAKIAKNNKEVIAASDIILKTNAFANGEIALAGNKIMATMANYVVNADMIYGMLKGNVTGLAWNCLADNSGYIFFPELENIKGRHCVNEIVWAWANKGLGTTNAKTTGAKRPSVLILNATWAAVEAARACLANNINVTILDNDSAYLNDLKSSKEIKELSAIYGATLNVDDAKFETMVKHFQTHDAFINTCIDPMSKTKPRITAEMAKSMPAGSIMIDAACENGYGFSFQKAFVSEKIDFKQFENIVYECVNDITDLYPLASSQIVSKRSVNYLISLAEKGVDANASLSNIIVVENQKVRNESVKSQLKLY